MGKKLETKHQQRVMRYFNKVAMLWDDIYRYNQCRFRHWIGRQVRSELFIEFRLTFRKIGDTQAKTLLDIGCGSGPYCVEAAQRGCRRVVGIDIADNMVQAARIRAEQEGVEDICTFVRHSFPNEALNEVFDYCIAIGVTDYVQDSAEFLTAVRKHTQLSAVVSFPSHHWFYTPFRKMRYKLLQCPVYFFNRNQVKDLLIASGFTHIRIIKIPGVGADYLAFMS